MLASIKLHEASPSKIKAPVLIIQGKNDPVFPEDHGHNLKDRIAKSELVILDDFGHALMPRHFDKVADLIDKFIKDIK